MSVHLGHVRCFAWAESHDRSPYVTRPERNSGAYLRSLEGVKSTAECEGRDRNRKKFALPRVYCKSRGTSQPTIICTLGEDSMLLASEFSTPYDLSGLTANGAAITSHLFASCVIFSLSTFSTLEYTNG